MTLISVTRLRVRSIRYLIPFLWDAMQSLSQVKRAPGNLGAIVRWQKNNVFWTLTAWKDETSMRAYMSSGTHRQTMPKLKTWCDEASVVHWQQDSPELPDWQTAEQMMISRGRFTPLDHPSVAHREKQFS